MSAAETTAPATAGRDAEILKLGAALWEEIQGERPGVFNLEYWHGRILDRIMSDDSFKTDMFRFVDVLPSLATSAQVSEHVREYLVKEGRELPGILDFALKAAAGGIVSGLAAKTIRKNVSDMARRFIIGQDAQSALSVLRRLHQDGIAFTVDLLGEVTVSEVEADSYQARYLDLIDVISAAAAKWPGDEVIDNNHLGPIPRANVSLKISAMDSQVDAVDPAGSVARLKERILPLFLRAKEKNVFLNMDLEHWDMHGITYDLFEEIVTHPELQDWPHVGIVVQTYLRCAGADLERMLRLAQGRGAPLTVRLVKGAYWDSEVVYSQQLGRPCPVLTEKAASDVQYEELTRMMFANLDYLHPALASHNHRSLVHALAVARELKLPPRAFEIQMLYGMAEPERAIFRQHGQRVRVYAPVGELLPGMAYFVRRLLENTANSGFLRLSHHDKVDIQRLLEPPRPQGAELEIPPRIKAGDLAAPFINCPLADFTDDEVRAAFARAMAEMKASLPLHVPLGINGETRPDRETLDRYCPSDTGLKVATVTLATREDADAAVAGAAAAWPQWRDRPLEERAQLLERLADRLAKDQAQLAALQAFEVGKPWREADADVGETIDFCRYYARQALIELGPRQQGNVAGEDNVMFYEGRGVAVIIAPWNFPLAILGGMTTAALVAGNTVIIKPSGQSAATAHALYERMLAVGFPPEVVQFFYGVGREIGNHLVEHPQVAQIAFTGSKAVGLAILEKAGKTHPDQVQVKRMVCEMGGKNAIIIDEDADLDAAVAGVMKSAFGYAGQKCSACSRVVTVGAAHGPFVKRLEEACRSLIIAPAHEPQCRLGPVVDADAYDRLREIINHPDPGAEPIYIGDAPAGGYFIGPALFAVNDMKHRFMQEEFFGPILSILTVKTFPEALEVAVSTEFALTGAVYSRLPSHLELARKRFRVGNLYLNSGSTGALVERQPFGGFAMSGIGTKAGGPGYLQHFADPRVVTENTMRRGFTPDVTM